MVKKIEKRVVIVLTPGRSGSSLLMKVLGVLGMRLSEEMIPGSIGNPEGHFEDTEIVQVHKDLLNELYTNPTLPAPHNWIESDPAIHARPKLKKILAERMAQSKSIWGFKDPRTITFLPLWSRILNQLGVVPVFLLAIRDPATVVASLNRQINREGAITEVQWLARTTEAIYHTAADCYIVHYEDWFTRPNELAKEILQYTELDQYYKGDIDKALKGVIKPNLNRAVHDQYTIQNEYVLKLYNVLKECKGQDFNRKRLASTVKKCRNAMNGFQGWYIEAHRYIRQNEKIRHVVKAKKKRLDKELGNVEIKKAEINKLKQQIKTEDKKAQTVKLENDKIRSAFELEKTTMEKRLRDADEKKKQITEMNNDLYKLTLQNNEQIKQIKDFYDEVENLRKQNSALRAELNTNIIDNQQNCQGKKKERNESPENKNKK